MKVILQVLDGPVPRQPLLLVLRLAHAFDLQNFGHSFAFLLLVGALLLEATIKCISLRIGKLQALLGLRKWMLLHSLILELYQLRLSQTVRIQGQEASGALAVELVALEQESLNEALVVDARERLFVLDLVVVTLRSPGKQPSLVVAVGVVQGCSCLSKHRIGLVVRVGGVRISNRLFGFQIYHST